MVRNKDQQLHELKAEHEGVWRHLLRDLTEHGVEGLQSKSSVSLYIGNDIVFFLYASKCTNNVDWPYPPTHVESLYTLLIRRLITAP